MKSLIMIAGPTAVGKTSLSIQLAKDLDGEIICADSMQIYKDMNIGTAKITSEEMSGIKHHMLDFVSPFDPYNVKDYSKAAKIIIDDCLNRNKTPIMVGGTGLYFNSIIYDMDFAAMDSQDGIILDQDGLSSLREELELLGRNKGVNAVYDILKDLDSAGAERIHPNNLRRVIRAIEIIKSTNGEKKIGDFSKDPVMGKYDFKLICMTMDRAKLYERINYRVDMMIEKGLIQEVEGLIKKGLNLNHQSMRGIGYKEIYDYLLGDIPFDIAIDNLKQNSRRYAKRQLTWFRRYEFAKWIDITAEDFSIDKLLQN